MTDVTTDFAFWSRAVLGALWCEGRGLSAEELAQELHVPLETLLPVIEVLAKRRVITLDDSGAVDDLEAARPGPVTRVRLASAG